MLNEINLIGREKLHYETLENIYFISIGKKCDLNRLRLNMVQTISDWDIMTGSTTNLKNFTNEYIENISKGSIEHASELYLLLSPHIFYIHALYEISRKSWRNVVTSCGIFCERILRNIFYEIDRQYNTNIYEEMKNSKFENKNGRIKKELESQNFNLADRLYSILKIIYLSRNRRGPHDVPPPESIQARITITHCLPAYIDYINALIFLGNDFSRGYKDFITFFSNLTQTKISLIFGDEIDRLTSTEIIKDILYKEGFFRDGKSLRDTQEKLTKLRYNLSSSLISNTLMNLSKGKDAILTRKGKRGGYKYVERLPPSRYFQKTI